MDASSSSSSPPWRPDLHRQMMNVHRKSKSEDLLREYKRLQEKDVFTDAELISGDGRKTCLHSLILAASSEFLKQWMEGTPMVNAQFTIMLPDASSEELEYLVNILYGVDCVVPEEVTSRLNDLIDLLGISIDLPFRTTVRNQAPVSEVLPICCWHCNLTCSNVEELETHIKIHQGEIFKRKHHKCHQCKKILPSMWKLRQHLATHKGEQSQQIVETVQQALPSDQDDHLYAERTVQSATIDQPTQASDHPYASFVASELTQTLTRRTDHLYSARKLSRKEAADLAAKKEQQMQMKKSDHLYSTPSSPSSPTSAAGTGDKRSLRLASKNVKQGKGQTSIPAKGKAKKGHTIQALGHSYAAARPRKVSGRASSGGSGGKRRSTSMFPCDQCDKEFPQPYRLNRHIREVHIKERKYSCRLCDKSFFKLTSMERHELTHSEHDIWKCGLCSKTFRDQSSLHYHTNKNVCLNKRSKQ